MNLAAILAMLKQFIPVLEPLGEAGINQLFDVVDAEVLKLKGDLADMAPILAKALREVALLEMRKLKG